ncbi:MAG TPA: hypothetical protein VGX76_17970 [Pirellulales bacterium]|jgi:hypothetical protein|nr:hypothetical protein [Pirellulales bacterium]
MTEPAPPTPPAGESRSFTFGDQTPPRNGAAPAQTPPPAKMQNKGRQATPEEAQQIRDRRQQTFDKARARNGQFASKEPEAPPAPPREPVDSIELTLPNGRAVVYGPPADVALTFRIIDICGDDAGASKVAIVRSLLCIRQIDGKPVGPLANMIDVQKLANMVGDDGLDVLYLLHNTTWPPLTIRDLPAVKKNMRQP